MTYQGMSDEIIPLGDMSIERISGTGERMIGRTLEIHTLQIGIGYFGQAIETMRFRLGGRVGGNFVA